MSFAKVVARLLVIMERCAQAMLDFANNVNEEYEKEKEKKDE